MRYFSESTFAPADRYRIRPENPVPESQNENCCVIFSMLLQRKEVICAVISRFGSEGMSMPYLVSPSPGGKWVGSG
jgi:hypothetical protein